MTTGSHSEPLLSVNALTVAYGGGVFSGAKKTIVENVSFDVRRGEITAIVGESGSGKSTILRAITGLAPVVQGEIALDGRVISGLSRRELRPLRKRYQMVFQDPYASLDPRMTIEDSVGEPLVIFAPDLDRAARREKIVQGLAEVGLQKDALARYPHEFSGGQRQRIAIARALITSPELLMLDEPVSALDVSVRAQVLNLLLDLRAARGLTYLFVSHDLAVVRMIADRVIVMSEGRIVEAGDAVEVIDRPQHAYTRALRAAVPKPASFGGAR